MGWFEGLHVVNRHAVLMQPDRVYITFEVMEYLGGAFGLGLESGLGLPLEIMTKSTSVVNAVKLLLCLGTATLH